MTPREKLNNALKLYLQHNGIDTHEVCLTNDSFSIMVNSIEIVNQIKCLFSTIREYITYEKNEIIIDGIVFEQWDGCYFVKLPLNVKF